MCIRDSHHTLRGIEASSIAEARRDLNAPSRLVAFYNFKFSVSELGILEFWFSKFGICETLRQLSIGTPNTAILLMQPCIDVKRHNVEYVQTVVLTSKLRFIELGKQFSCTT